MIINFNELGWNFRRGAALYREAPLVRAIFERFTKTGSATVLVKELVAEGHRTKTWITAAGRQRRGKPIDKGHLYRLLNNRAYLGEAVHKGTAYPGEHKAIVPRALWDKAHAILTQNARSHGNRTRARTPALLKGLLRCTACNAAMTPTHTNSRGRRYRYYICVKSIKNGAATCEIGSIAAAEIEGVVTGQVRRLLQTPEIAARTIAACNETDGDEPVINEREVVEALGRIDDVWDELFPAEQARIIRLLVQGIEVAPDGVDVHLRVDGIHGLAGELMPEAPDTGTSLGHAA